MTRDVRRCVVCEKLMELKYFQLRSYVSFAWTPEGGKTEVVEGWVCDADVSVVAWMLRADP